MSKKGSSIKGITWQETSNGPLFEDSYLGVTLEILDHQPTGYAIHVNGEQDCEYFPSIDAAKDYANSLGTISLASAQVRIRQKLPDFGMHLRSIGFRDGDNAIRLSNILSVNSLL